RLHRQCASDRHALLLAAGETPGVGVLLAVQTDLGQQRAAARDGLATPLLLHLHRAFDDILEGGPMGEQVEVLEHETDMLAQLADQPLLRLERPVRVDVDRPDADLPAAGLLQQVEAAQQGGLARTAGADDRQYLAGSDVEVDALEHLLAIEGFPQVSHGDHQASCSWRLTRCSRRPWKYASTL